MGVAALPSYAFAISSLNSTQSFHVMIFGLVLQIQLIREQYWPHGRSPIGVALNVIMRGDIRYRYRLEQYLRQTHERLGVTGRRAALVAVSVDPGGDTPDLIGNVSYLSGSAANSNECGRTTALDLKMLARSGPR